MSRCCNRVYGREVRHSLLVQGGRREEVGIQVALSNQRVFSLYSLLLFVDFLRNLTTIGGSGEIQTHLESSKQVLVHFVCLFMSFLW